MKLYTKGGDKGKTGLVGGERVPKHHRRIEAYGDVDEMNAFLGWILAQNPWEELVGNLGVIQSHLFEVGAQLATPSNVGERSEGIGEEDVLWLEGLIDISSTQDWEG